MVPHTLAVLLLASRAVWPGDAAPRDDGSIPESEPDVVAARYEAEKRAVTNWRHEAMEALEPKPVAVLAALIGADRPVVTRCVKLNNYWCIKSARWNGELAADGEGHVGFASADHGADAAATLLRRYYLDFNRKSALDIVRRWAPAECQVATGIGGAVLAVKGIGGTLRARYLAGRSKKRGGAVRYTAQGRPGGKPGRVSMSLSVKTPQYRVPDIAVGMGERKKPKAEDKPPPRAAKARPVRQPTTTASIPPKPAPKTQAATACAPDEQRIRNYAGRIAAALGLAPTDDLRLFAPDGTPLPNLRPVMLAMSAFELGMLRASPDLVEKAIRRAAARVQESARAELPQAQPRSLER